MRRPSAPARPRAGIVGPGTIGRLHAATLEALGTPVTGLVASSLASARDHADRLGVANAYGSVEEMLASGAVDVVHVCTPNAAHADVALAAIEAGCQLVCEKPLTLQLVQANELVRCAQRAGVRGGTCYHFRYFAGIAAARKLVQSGALGAVRMVAGRYVSQELRDVDPGHWLRDPAVVGPALSLADVGVHWFDLAEHVTGERIRAVHARPAVAGGADAFAHGAVVLMQLGDAAATAAVSQACVGIAQDDMTLDVHGSAGTLRWALSAAGESLQAWGEQGPLAVEGRYAQTFKEGTERAFAALLDAIYERIGSDRSDAPTLEDGRHGVAILDAAVASAERGCWVEVPCNDDETRKDAHVGC